MISKELQKRIFSSILILPICLIVIVKGSYFFIIFIMILFVISLFEWIKINKKNEFKYFGILFLFFSFYFTYLLRNQDSRIFLFILTICVTTDLGGYFFGKILKGPKLTSISPSKTVSGMIGSYLLALITSVLFRNKIELSIGNLNIEDNITFLIIVMVISTISQTGDLIISIFKRRSNIKDTGKILPGHGGLLDRIDGMIFVFPSSYLILNFLL